MNKTKVRYLLLQFYEIKFNIDWHPTCNVFLLLHFFLSFLGSMHILPTTETVVVYTLRASTTSLTPGLTGWSLLRSKTVHFKTDKIIESWVVVFVFHFQSSSIRMLTRVRFPSYHVRLTSRGHSQLFAGCLRDYRLINFETFNSEEIVIGCFHQRRSSR